VLFCVLFLCKCVLPPGDNPAAVNKCIIYHIKSVYTITNFKHFSIQILGSRRRCDIVKNLYSEIHHRLSDLCVSTNQHGRQEPSVSKFLIAASANDEDIMLPSVWILCYLRTSFMLHKLLETIPHTLRKITKDQSNA
jgi:hypothetical protein